MEGEKPDCVCTMATMVASIPVILWSVVDCASELPATTKLHTKLTTTDLAHLRRARDSASLCLRLLLCDIDSLTFADTLLPTAGMRTDSMK